MSINITRRNHPFGQLQNVTVEEKQDYYVVRGASPIDIRVLHKHSYAIVVTEG